MASGISICTFFSDIRNSYSGYPKAVLRISRILISDTQKNTFGYPEKKHLFWICKIMFSDIGNSYFGYLKSFLDIRNNYFGCLKKINK